MAWCLEFSLTEEELHAAGAFTQTRLLATEGRRGKLTGWGFAFVLLGGAIGFLAYGHNLHTEDRFWRWLLACLAGMYCLWIAYSRGLNRRLRQSIIASNPGLHTEPRALTLDEDGLRMTWRHGDSAFSWEAATDIQRCGPVSLIYLDQANCLPLPDRVFASDEERQSCLGFIRNRIEAAKSLAPSGKGPRRPAAFSWRQAMAGAVRLLTPVAATLLAGLRLAFFRPPGATALPPTPYLLPGLMGLGLALHFGAAFLAVDGPGQWNIDGLAGTAFPVALALAAAAVLAALAGQSAALPGLVTLLMALAFPLYLTELLLEIIASRQAEDAWLVRYGHYIVPLWLALASAVAAIGWANLSGPRRAGAFSATCLLLALPLSTVQFGGALWIAKDEQAADAAKYYALAGEEAFYQQPKLLDAALERVQAQRPGVTDLYFVGLGGYAGQDVFLKEVRAVEHLMGERFGAAGRSVSLVNNYASVADYPVASATGLKRALQHIGRTMDKEEDILFLFMTSHGSREAGVNIDFWPMRFHDIAPAALRQMLDESGVKWRVVVVSACYSGVFVEPLRDEHTIVLTAAAPDRNSFGCSNELDWTYFGQAFFDQALRYQTDLVTAFEQAKHYIEQREIQENADQPSQPQIAAGEAMRAKWAAYASQLAPAAPAAAITRAATN